MTDAWITVREGTPHSAAVTTATGVAIDQQVTVGRTGHIVVGIDVADSGISRVVATITATPHGWTVRDTSRNGIVIHPWGLAPLRATTDVRLHWPLIGLRILGAEPDARHWSSSNATDTSSTAPTRTRSSARPCRPIHLGHSPPPNSKRSQRSSNLSSRGHHR